MPQSYSSEGPVLCTIGRNACNMPAINALGVTKFRGRYSGDVLEVLSEGRLVAEIKSVGYLLYVFAGVAQHVFGLKYDILVYPLHGAAPCGLAYEHRQVFGSDEELFGIELHGALLTVVTAHQVEKLVHITHSAAARCRGGAVGRDAAAYIEQFIKQGGKKIARYALGIRISLRLKSGEMQSLKHGTQHAARACIDRHRRGMAEREHFHVDDIEVEVYVIHELARYKQQGHIELLALVGDRLDKVIGPDDDKRVRGYLKCLRIDLDGSQTRLHYHDAEAVDAAYVGYGACDTRRSCDRSIYVAVFVVAEVGSYALYVGKVG